MPRGYGVSACQRPGPERRRYFSDDQPRRARGLFFAGLQRDRSERWG